MKTFKYLLTVVFLSAFCYLLVAHFLFRNVIVSGNSMLPTLHDSEIYTLKTYAYLFHNPRIGDVVVIKDPSFTKTVYSVKRIVAREGQTVSFTNGIVYIDGKQLIESSYLTPNTKTFPMSKTRFVCEKNQYFVLGDNRAVSADGREYGPIPRKNILGQIQP